MREGVKNTLKKTLNKFLEKLMRVTKIFLSILNQVNEGDGKNKKKENSW